MEINNTGYDKNIASLSRSVAAGSSITRCGTAKEEEPEDLKDLRRPVLHKQNHL